MSDTYVLIKKDKQIKKFCLYGFLKNLKFFEPYLIIYLLGMGYTLFHIGLLYSIRSFIVYIFEVPSGIIADTYGKKKALMACFIFYILSFILFFLGSSFYFMALAMIAFGLGESFRSGTHKAMIYSYLEQKDWFDFKTFVYGRTRSFSLFGSAISSFTSIILILNLPSTKWIFLVCIIPYLIDFFLISTYPISIDEKNVQDLKEKNIFKYGWDKISIIAKNKNLRNIIGSASLYDAIFVSIKNYIQPILLLAVGSIALVSQLSLTEDTFSKVILGITYGVFYIASSYGSKNSYRLNKRIQSNKLMMYSFDLLAVLLLILSIVIYYNMIFFIILIFFMLYVIADIRRPIFVDICGNNMCKENRATVLSINSQVKSLLTIVLAPLAGLIADLTSISILFLCLGCMALMLNRFLKIK